MKVKMFSTLKVPSARKILRVGMTAFAVTSTTEALSLSEYLKPTSLSQTKSAPQEDIDFVLA